MVALDFFIIKTLYQVPFFSYLMMAFDFCLELRIMGGGGKSNIFFVIHKSVARGWTVPLNASEGSSVFGFSPDVGIRGAPHPVALQNFPAATHA